MSHSIGSRFEADLAGLPQRVEEYKRRAREADRVLIVLACSDSRVVFPESLVEVRVKNGSRQKVLFVRIPTIGGGVPSRSRLRGVINTIRSWGVDPRKLSVLVTQHGDTAEVTFATSALHTSTSPLPQVTCGLRTFLLQHEETFKHINALLIPWSDLYKQQTGDVRNAPDRLSLKVLEDECPEVMELVNKMSDQTKLPRRLIVRAAYRNKYFDMIENGEKVRRSVAEYLREAEYQDIFPTCAVGIAHYDHQQKKLIFANTYANLGFSDQEITLPTLQPRTDSFQDPEYVVISFGQQAISLHKGVILPSFVGQGTDALKPPADNAFRACAAIKSVYPLLSAFAEAAYAVGHHLQQHYGDQNFRSLKRVIVLCDNAEYVAVLKDAVKDQEFIKEYRQMFAAINEGNLDVINLDIAQVKPNNSENQSSKPQYFLLDIKASN